MGLSFSAERLSFQDASAVDFCLPAWVCSQCLPPILGYVAGQMWRNGGAVVFLLHVCLKGIPCCNCVGKPQTQSSTCDISFYNNPCAEKQGKNAHIAGEVGSVDIAPTVVQEDSAKWAARSSEEPHT